MVRLADVGLSGQASAAGARLSGGCACGDVRYVATGPGRYHLLCQCRDCQRFSGAGHAAAVVAERAGFSVSGKMGAWRTVAASGHGVTRRFCVRCGSPVMAEMEGHPEGVALVAATLDDAARFKPGAVVWTSSGREWDHIHPQLKRFEHGARPAELPPP